MYLESKMLEEVSSAIGLVSLCPATGVDPDTNGRSLSPGRVLGGDLPTQLAKFHLSLSHRVGPTYGEAIGEGRRLRLRAVAERSGQTPGQRVLKGAQRSTIAHATLQVQRQPLGCHREETKRKTKGRWR
jgi:hypothetical protein